MGSVTLALGLGRWRLVVGGWRDLAGNRPAARVAQFLPADQQLHARGVTGSLRSGAISTTCAGAARPGRPGATDLRLGWQLIPLLQRRLELGELHAAQVQITRWTPPGPRAPAPPTALVLPCRSACLFGWTGWSGLAPRRCRRWAWRATTGSTGSSTA